MAFYQLAVIAIVQGITEFLPISSSGHLVLIPETTAWPDQGLMIDVAVHVGTLGAVVAYLWRDVLSLCAGVAGLAKGRLGDDARLLGLLAVATVPVVIAGLLVKTYAGDSLRSVEVIAWTTLGFGVVLYAADRLGVTLHRVENMKAGGALMIGLAQVLALVPGVSRAGITITAARMLGYERREAARFSMLLSLPTIVAAGGLVTLDLIESGNAELRGDAFLAAGLAFATALIAIVLMMGWLRRASFAPFVVYRVILGAGLLFWLYA